MISARTRQINVYGKRSRRIVDAPPLSENPMSGTSTSDSSKTDRIPLIHRMKKRENNGVAKSKPPSPKIVGLTKQRVVSNGSPTRKRRGTRLAEILAQETKPRVKEGLNVDSGIPPMTPSRMPLSALAMNTLGSPVPPSGVMKFQKKPSPKSLVTTRKLSTVQMDIQVLDEKGQTLKQEKRTARTDIVVNSVLSTHPEPNSNASRVSRKPEPARATTSKKRVFAPKQARAPEVISIGSSVDDFPQHKPKEAGTQTQSIILSSSTCISDDAENTSRQEQPIRRTRRATARIIISDDSATEEDDEEGEYLPSESLTKRPRKSIHRSTRKTIPMSGTTKPLGLKVEVVVPSAPYNIHTTTTAAPPPPIYSHILSDASSRPSPTARAKPLPAPPLYRATYNLIPSPPLKPRPLTPIRRRQGATGLFAPPSPPSPTTPSDFELSLEFSRLDIGLAPEELEALHSTVQAEYPEYLRPLLEECRQEKCGPYEFSAFIESFPFDPILRDTPRGGSNVDLRFRKIGEASYSEVFGIGDVVLKVIPLRDETCRIDDDDGEDGPAPSDAKDVRKEIIVTRAMGEVHDGFVKLLKTYVVRGKYPEVLLNLWDEYHQCKGSESVRPDTFTVSQKYAIIVLPNGGPDLEAYSFPNPSKMGWRQACSVFWQVAKALAHAEQLVSFEHRDLHWGQILVKNLPIPKPAPLRTLTHTLNQGQRTQVKAKYMDDLAHGVQVTIIDLGLSRMDAGDGQGGDLVHWTPFDEETFMGEGDYQFDVYRFMRDHTLSNWEKFHPLTNVMWLHYLVIKLLRHKSLKPPSVSRKARLGPGNEDASATTRIFNVNNNTGNVSATPFTEQDCYDCLVDIEEWLGRRTAEFVPKPKPRGKARKTVTPAQIKATMVAMPLSGPACAGEVVGYAVKKRWVRPTS